jgi:hypothetical protein
VGAMLHSNFFVDDILLIGNDLGAMPSVKMWLSSHFAMKEV